MQERPKLIRKFGKGQAIVFNKAMEKPKKRIHRLDLLPEFEEKDHRLACGWHVEIEGSGQRKRYLKALKAEEAANQSA